MPAHPSGAGAEPSKHPLFPFEPDAIISALHFRGILAVVVSLAALALLSIFLVVATGRARSARRAGDAHDIHPQPALPLADARAGRPLPGAQETLTASFPPVPEPMPRPSIFRPQPPRPWPKLPHLRGVMITTNDVSMNLVFEKGLFERWNEFAPDGRLRLQAVGRGLRGRIGGFDVVVEGHADPGRLPPECPVQNNDALALIRARLAAAELRQAAELEGGRIRAVSMGDRYPPYPNTSRDSRARNRTVVIKLVRAPNSNIPTK